MWKISVLWKIALSWGFGLESLVDAANNRFSMALLAFSAGVSFFVWAVHTLEIRSKPKESED